MSFPLARLSDIAIIDRISVSPDKIKDGTLYVGLEHITHKGTFHNVSSVTQGELASSKFLFTSEHLLYGKLRPYLKKIVRPSFSGICSTDIIPIKSNGKVNIDYLCYFLRTQRMIDLATTRATGANLPRLSPKQLANFKIPLPPLKTQKQIAAVLDRADALIRTRQRSIEKLDELVHSLFLEMFGDPATNSKKFQVKTLKELSVIQGQYGAGASAAEFYADYGRYVRITDIQENGQLKNEKVSADLSDKDRQNYLLEQGDILFARSGATVGKTYIHNNKNDHYFAGYLIRFRVDKNLVMPMYVYNYTKTIVYKKWVKSKQRVVAQPNINAKQYGNELMIPVPPMHLQIEFSKQVQAIESQKAIYQKSLNFLQTLFDSLMQRAFNGELELNESAFSYPVESIAL